MKRISFVLLSIVLVLSVIVGCAKKNTAEQSANVSNNAVTAGTKSTTQANPSEAEITIDEAYNWYVGDIWNPITSFRDYIESGTGSSGETFDAKFAYEQYQKKITMMDKYTTYIHEKHPDIASTWDKMMEQVKIVNQNLADGFETGSEKINTDLLSQYSEAFYDYYNNLPST